MYAETQAGTPAPATPAPPTPPRKTAKALSLVRYQSDQPCKRGHLAPRFTKGGQCSACHREWTRTYRANAKANLLQARRWLGGHMKFVRGKL